MAKEAYQRFVKSMSIGFDQWHDGEGYDLDAVDQLTDSEKKDVERLLVPRAGNDWRDLDALDRLGTANATKAILRVRKMSDADIRLRAHEVGPAPTPQEWDDAILYALPKVEPYSGLTVTIRCAMAHPSEAVMGGLWTQVRNPESKNAYHCAEALICISGLSDSLYDDKYRPLFLRFVGPASDDRTAAVEELERLCHPA